MKFQFSDQKELAQWLEKQAEGLKKQAEGTRNVRSKAFSEGGAHELSSLAKMLREETIVIGVSTPPPLPPVQVYVKNDEDREERPSAANNSFLQWVRSHYSLNLYRRACSMVEAGNVSEDEIRKYLSQAAGDK